MALQLMKKLFTEKVMSAEERRSVLEDLFVFGKDNQRPYLFRMSVLLILSTVRPPLLLPAPATTNLQQKKGGGGWPHAHRTVHRLKDG